MSGAIPLHAPKGHVLFRPDDACQGFVVLREGVIRVSLTAANGREIVLYRVRPGDVCLQTFSCLVEGVAYASEGVAETDIDGELIPVAEFHRRMAEDAAFRSLVLGAVASRFHAFERLVEDVALSGFEARLARALLRLRGDDGQVHATHEQLAAETGSAREVVSRQLARFARAGWVTAGRGVIAIRDVARLEDAAAELGD